MRRIALGLGLVMVLALGTPSATAADGHDGHALSPSSSPSSLTSVAGTTGASVYKRNRDDLVRLLEQRGSASALDELARRSQRDPKVAGVCHAIAHDLGHAALEAAKGRISVVLGERDDVCGGGFTHGAVEMALGGSTQPERDLLTICAPAQDGSCFHGVGHGLMFATSMNVAASLALCDHAPSRRLSARCAEGVFMQLFSGDAASGHMVNAPAGFTTPTLAAAARTCAATRVPYNAACWFYTPTLWLADHPDDFLGALRWCESRGTGRAMCTKGLGSRTVKFHPEDPRIGGRVCAAAMDIGSCLSGMGSYWSVHWRGERSPRDVCGRLGDTDLERRCRSVT